MNALNIIEKIHSKYILQNIFDYISDSIFKLKLFTYSKVSQKQLEIHFLDYVFTYFLNRLDIN